MPRSASPRYCVFVAALLTLNTACVAAVAAPVDAELLLQGGMIIDGAGGPGRVGNVAVSGDQIVAVGEFEVGRVDRTLDCAGLIVTPGFIDLHNHSDQTVETTAETPKTPRVIAPSTKAAFCYLAQGCTTLVTGNCGGGALLVGEYYDRIDAAQPGVNVAHLIPQGAVREAVIGATRRGATDDELVAMKELTRRGMEQGAWGMSTGLQYVPSSYASTEEIAELAAVVAQYDGIYASHIRDEGDRLAESIDEALEIGRRSGAAVHVSHLKASKRRNWGKVRVAAAMIEAAQEEGLRVTADQYPYAASSTSIAAMLLPDEEREGSRSDLTGRLSDPEQLVRLRPVIDRALEERGEIMVAECPAHPEWVGKRIREIAQEENREMVEVALDIIRSGDEAGVSFSMDLADVRWVMSQPWVATASDGSAKVRDGTMPHPRSFGTFARRIGRFAIEDEVVTVEQAVRSATGLPAEILGMTDRGCLREGAIADIAVFDPTTFRDHATFESPFEPSTGVRWVLVGGAVAIDGGKPARLDAGRALRKTPSKGG